MFETRCCSTWMRQTATNLIQQVPQRLCLLLRWLMQLVPKCLWSLLPQGLLLGMLQLLPLVQLFITGVRRNSACLIRRLRGVRLCQSSGELVFDLSCKSGAPLPLTCLLSTIRFLSHRILVLRRCKAHPSFFLVHVSLLVPQALP